MTEFVERLPTKEPCVICGRPTTNTLDGPAGVAPVCAADANEWIEDHAHG